MRNESSHVVGGNQCKAKAPGIWVSFSTRAAVAAVLTWVVRFPAAWVHLLWLRSKLQWGGVSPRITMHPSVQRSRGGDLVSGANRGPPVPAARCAITDGFSVEVLCAPKYSAVWDTSHHRRLIRGIVCFLASGLMLNKPQGLTT